MVARTASGTVPTTSAYRAALAEFGEPFAKAFAVFARELLADRTLPECQPSAADERRQVAHLRAIVERNAVLRKSGQLDEIELTDETTAEAAADRLRRVAQEQGLSQKEIAARMGVTPAVINRIFKNPRQSRVSTLKRLADALGVELHEIV